MKLHERFIGLKEGISERLEERKIRRIIDSCHNTASKIMAGHDSLTSNKHVSMLVSTALAKADFERRFCSTLNPVQGKRALAESVFENMEFQFSKKVKLSVFSVSHDAGIEAEDGNYTPIIDIQNEIANIAHRIINAYYGKKKHQAYAADDFEEHIRSISFVRSKLEEVINNKG